MKYHVDTDYDGSRLVDNVIPLEEPKKYAKKILVYSPLLRADILIWRKDLAEGVGDDNNNDND
jgi:hypothetical protein